MSKPMRNRTSAAVTNRTATQRVPRLVALLIAAIAMIAGVAPAVSAQSEDDRPFVVLEGRGWGHGRGMGQWGAQGYAKDQGWSSPQILDHFYGGTRAGTLAEAISPVEPAVNPDAVRVEIRAQRGNAMRLILGSGTMEVVDLATGELLTTTQPGEAVKLQVNGVGGLNMSVSDSCGGAETPVAVFTQPAIEVRAITEATGADGLLRLCKPNGSSNWYSGVMRAHNIGGQTRTVNVLPLEELLRGIVPREVPASWEPAALEAQSVAARSYAAAGDTRQLPYADSCDTILCQVYEGRFRQSAPDASVDAVNHPRTDAAILATAGLIRIHNDTNEIARTEFSSSTGGYSAGGDFPAVEDTGDSVDGNKRHMWSKAVDLGPLEARTGLGNLDDVQVTERNGFGPDGGRVLEVTFVFERGTTTMTGNEARREFGLFSDWFTPGPVTRSFSGSDAALYVIGIYELFLGRPATPSEQARWIDAVDAGRRQELTDGLSLSDEWAGVVVDDLYQSALGRSADEEGREHWRGQIAAGVRVEDIGTLFYGSAEYFERAGGTNERFIQSLYTELLGRDADPEGLNFWVGRLENEGWTPADVARGFYESIESRRSRVINLYQRILNRDPDAAGLEYWAEQLLTTDDIRLASQLAASEESYIIRTP